MCFPPLLAIAPPTELALAVVWRPPPSASRIAEPADGSASAPGPGGGGGPPGRCGGWAESRRLPVQREPGRCRPGFLPSSLAPCLLPHPLSPVSLPSLSAISGLGPFRALPHPITHPAHRVCANPPHTLRHRKSSCQLRQPSSLRRPLFPAFLGHPTPNWPALCRNPEFIRKTWREGRRGVGIEIREAEDIGSTPLRDTQIF